MFILSDPLLVTMYLKHFQSAGTGLTLTWSLTTMFLHITRQSHPGDKKYSNRKNITSLQHGNQENLTKEQGGLCFRTLMYFFNN